MNQMILNQNQIQNIFVLQWYIQATTATEGTGLYEGLGWLVNELQK